MSVSKFSRLNLNLDEFMTINPNTPGYAALYCERTQLGQFLKGESHMATKCSTLLCQMLAQFCFSGFLLYVAKVEH